MAAFLCVEGVWVDFRLHIILRALSCPFRWLTLKVGRGAAKVAFSCSRTGPASFCPALGAGRSLGLVAIDGAHELVRELGVVCGLASGIESGLTAAGSALLKALHCVLGKAQRLHQGVVASHTDP